MSNDPFNRNKTKEARLGEIITEVGEQNQRDAIHIAVVPVVAGCALRPGQHVGISADGKTATQVGPYVGIVDPFLMAPAVRDGQTFWLCLYQGQVTTLRHEWTHPAFPSVSQPQGRSQIEDSKAWLRQYAKRVNDYYADDGDKSYETLMDDIRRKDYLTYHGTDMHGLGDLQDAEELAHHASIVLGAPVNWSEFEGFSCSC